MTIVEKDSSAAKRSEKSKDLFLIVLIGNQHHESNEYI